MVALTRSPAQLGFNVKLYHAESCVSCRSQTVEVLSIQSEERPVKTAKLFQNGRSQVVRLPRAFENDPWELFEEGLSELADDFLAERNQPDLQEREFQGSA